MTKRKPPEMSFDGWIDEQIREAKERGLFDDLAGAGKPQPTLADADDPLWWLKQFLHREQVSILPPALEVRVRAQKLRETLAGFPSERALREAAEALNVDIRRVNRTASHGPPTAQAPLDVDDLAEGWRAARPVPPPSGSAAPRSGAGCSRSPTPSKPPGSSSAASSTAQRTKGRAS